MTSTNAKAIVVVCLACTAMVCLVWISHVGSAHKKDNKFQKSANTATARRWSLKESSLFRTSDYSTGASQSFVDRQGSASLASPLLAFNPGTSFLNAGLQKPHTGTANTPIITAPKNKYFSMRLPGQAPFNTRLPAVQEEDDTSDLIESTSHDDATMQLEGGGARNGNRITTSLAPSSDSTAAASRFDTNLFATSTVSQSVTPTSRSLEQYMQLPIEGYTLLPMREGTGLKRIDGAIDLFELEAPSLKFFTIEVKPIIVARVSVTPSAVLISAQKCVLRGSPIVNKLGLNDRFVVDAQLEFTWSADTIYSKSEIAVDVDLQAIFSYLPTRLVVSTGNRVVRRALNLIQGDFLKALGSDFERWSADDDYFKERGECLESDECLASLP